MSRSRVSRLEAVRRTAYDELWFVNTRFSCLATHDPDHSFAPVWRPKFISQLTPDDRCHLNGLGLVDGRPRWVTALGETDTAGGWRENKKSGGILIDIDSNEIVARGLSMPHSPRWHAGRLWLLESGTGSLGHVDLTTGRYEPIVHLDGFTRGLEMVGNLAFVGLSQVRETAVFSGIQITERLQETERTCGVWVVDIQRGQVVAFLKFEEAVQEIFAVALLPGIRFPDLINDNAELVGSSFVLPDAALRDVPAELRAATLALQAEGQASPAVRLSRPRCDWSRCRTTTHWRQLALPNVRTSSCAGATADAIERLHCSHAFIVFACVPDVRDVTSQQRRSSTGKLRALIIDGQNNHDWKTTTPLLEEGAGIERPVHGRRRHVAAGRRRS